MGNKVVLIGIVVVGVIVAYVIWFAAGLDFHREAAALAINGSVYSGNMTGLTDAVNSSPWWLSFLPAFVGIIAVIMILRQPERR